ncbi:6-O-methylguanine DNA methyltransferase [Sporodiniella umbellata]|nr:6-O-methylguanine DNA methyltransferase [Sporodiniella umbellata]
MPSITKTKTKKSIKKEVVQTFVANNKDIHIYDLVAQIPEGHVTSYKVLSEALKSAPRAVGQALRINPFAPLPVPCHRVIATDFSIGGFSGKAGDCQNTANKKAMLELEGCSFNENYLFNNNVDGSKTMFKDFK